MDFRFFGKNPKRPPIPEPNNQENSIRLKESSFPWKVVCSSRRNTNWEIIEPNPKQKIMMGIIDNTSPFLYYILNKGYYQNCFFFSFFFLLCVSIALRTNIIRDRIIILDPGQIHHLSSVKRLKKGDRVVVFDGESQEYECVIDDIAKDKAELSVWIGGGSS